MKSLSHKLLGTLAAGALTVTAASPAMAQDRNRDRGIDGGDILAGALIIGGIAAVAAAVGSDRDDRRYDERYDPRYDQGYDPRYDRGYDARYDRRNTDAYDRYDQRNQGYDYRGYQQQAVEQCARAAERTAARYTRGGRAEVYDIRDIDRQRTGFEVSGRIAVADRGRNYRSNNRDEGRFTCEVRRGRVVDLDFSGIRGL